MTAQVGAASAPLLVVPIQARYGWQASFFVFGVLGVIVGGGVVHLVPRPPAEKRGVPAAERQKSARNRRPPRGMPWGAALRNGSSGGSPAIGACYVYALAFYQAWLQTYLVRGHGYTEAALVLSSFPYIVGGVANGCGGLAQ